MPRLFPRSLMGQLVLAVAMALIVAQAISGLLLWRGIEERRDAELVNSIALRLVNADTGQRAARRGNGEGPRLRLPLEGVVLDPIGEEERRFSTTEDRLRILLEQQGLRVEDIAVVRRPALGDPLVRARSANRPQFRARLIDREIYVAAIRWVGADGWLVARVPEPPRAPRILGGLAIQSLLLLALVLLPLVYAIRRITRPLSALTRRTERFAATRDASDQLEPVGPDDVRRLTMAHNALESRIAALLDEKDVMLGAIGHDLKTPLAALRVRIENVEDDGQRAKMAATIEDIAGTLDDILSLARVGRPSDPVEPTDLAALAAQVVEEFEDMGEPVVLGETQRAVAPVRVTWMRRALRNLVSNAVRYGGKAEVAVERDGERVRITVADEGPGLPPDQLEAMFEPFARGEASRNRATGGAGLGLTLARAIAEQHGGTLVLQNRDGGGLVAEIGLPSHSSTKTM